MDKQIRIKKCDDFSKTGPVSIITANRILKIKDYNFHSITISPSESILIKQQWVKSRKYYSEDFKDNLDYVICPTMGKRLALIVLVIVSFSICFFFFTKNKWTMVPLGLLGAYILGKIILFPSSYFRIKEAVKPSK